MTDCINSTKPRWKYILNHIVIWFIATRRHNIISDQSGWDVSRKTNASESRWWKLQQIFVKIEAQGGRKKRNCWTRLLVFFWPLTIGSHLSARHLGELLSLNRTWRRKHGGMTITQDRSQNVTATLWKTRWSIISVWGIIWHETSLARYDQTRDLQQLQCCTHSSGVALDIGLGLQTTSWGSRSRLRSFYRAWYRSGTGRTGDFDPDQCRLSQQCNNTIITVKNQAADILSSTDNSQSDTLPLIPYLEGIALHTTLLFIKYE